VAHSVHVLVVGASSRLRQANPPVWLLEMAG